MIAITSYPKQGSILAGRYRLISLLGKGGMGRVFRARDTATGESRAVKLLKPEHVSRTKIAERFRQESRLAATLDHEHICPVLDHGTSGEGVPFLVMPLLLGKTLGDRLKIGQLSIQEATRYTLETLDALQEAHRKRIVHRDLKPSNIMLAAQNPREQKRVVVLDFGISKMLDTDVSLTTAGGSLGTPAYMAPEQAASLDYDHRIDIYALGVVLYEMLTGQSPFSGDTPKSVKHKLTVRAPLPPSRLNPSVSKALQQVIMTAMAHNPEDRFVDAEEMSTAIREAGSASSGTIRVQTQEQTARDIQPNIGSISSGAVSTTRPHEIRVQGQPTRNRDEEPSTRPHEIRVPGLTHRKR